MQRWRSGGWEETEGRKRDGRCCENNFGVGWLWTPGPRGTRTITLDSDMVAAAISRGANALVLGCCDFLCLEKTDCFEVLVIVMVKVSV